MLSSRHIDACAIVVSSFDGFADLWKPFFTLLFRYWPDCPYQIYLISNEKTYDDPRVTTLAIGADGKWANNLFAALDRIPAAHIIYMQDDFFLTQKVDTAKIHALIDHAIKNNIACIHLFPGTGPDMDYPEAGLGIISKHADYRVSLQCVLWDVKKLRELMQKGESGWDMELRGTERSRETEGIFLSVYEPVISYIEGATKGKWNIPAIWHCFKEGVRCKLTARGINYGMLYRAQKDRLRKTVKKFIGVS